MARTTTVGEVGFDRITKTPGVMDGKPCIRGMRVTVGMIAGQIDAGVTIKELLEDYPYLEPEDVTQASEYAKLHLIPVNCPCCGLPTLENEGCYEWCDDCDWQDDPTQRTDPDKVGGFNVLSLNESKVLLARGQRLPLPPNVEIFEFPKS